MGFTLSDWIISNYQYYTANIILLSKKTLFGKVIYHKVLLDSFFTLSSYITLIASCNVQLTNMHQSQIADKEFDYMANIILIHPSICDSVLETHIFGCCFIQTGYTWGTWGEIDMEAWPSYCGLCP